MGVGDRENRAAAFAGRLERARQATVKGGLREAEFRIDLDSGGLPARDDRFDRAKHSARNELLAVALEVIEPADHVAGLFGPAHRARDRSGDPVLGAVTHKGRARYVEDLVKADRREFRHDQ